VIARRLCGGLERLRVSASIGVATSAELEPGLAPEARSDALLAAADRAMYETKRERQRKRESTPPGRPPD
jgi:GGDEF domain-containing protein